MINIHFSLEVVGVLREAEGKSQSPAFLGQPDADHHLLFGQTDKNLPALGEVGGLNFQAHLWFLVAVLELISFLLRDGDLHWLI